MEMHVVDETMALLAVVVKEGIRGVNILEGAHPMMSQCSVLCKSNEPVTEFKSFVLVSIDRVDLFRAMHKVYDKHINRKRHAPCVQDLVARLSSSRGSSAYCPRHMTLRHWRGKACAACKPRLSVVRWRCSRDVPACPTSSQGSRPSLIALLTAWWTVRPPQSTERSSHRSKWIKRLRHFRR